MCSSRATGVQRRLKLGDPSEARTEEVILAQVAEFRSHFQCHRKVVVNDQRNAGLFGYRQDLFREAANLLG